MMVMAAALAKLILPSVMMTSKFWWRATTWQSDDWFQMQGTVKRGHLMAMKLPKGPPGARHHPGRQRTAREQSATILLPNSRIFRSPARVGHRLRGTAQSRTRAAPIGYPNNQLAHFECDGDDGSCQLSLGNHTPACGYFLRALRLRNAAACNCSMITWTDKG